MIRKRKKKEAWKLNFRQSKTLRTEGAKDNDVPLCMEFDLAELGGAEPLEAFEAVFAAADFEVAEAGEFGFGGGDDDFAADVVGDGVFAAEIGHQADSAHGKPGFQRAGFVVKAAVEDAAVVRALMAAGGVFFFKDANGGTGLADEQFTGDGETDDASADDKMVMFFQRQFLLGCDQTRRHGIS